MAKKQGKQNQNRLAVNLRYVATPNGEARFSRAIAILLGAAARHAQSAKKEEPLRQAPVQDTQSLHHNHTSTIPFEFGETPAAPNQLTTVQREGEQP